VALQVEHIDVFPTPKAVIPHALATRRPRILAIADVPHWIFERHARSLQTLLADEFDIVVQYHTQAFDEDAYDLIYALEYGLVATDRIISPWKYVTALRSHVSWSNTTPATLAQYLRAYFQQTHVVSARLQRDIAPHLPDVAYVTHGIDANIFQPILRTPTTERALRVGWAGNRETAVKGFDEFIRPLGELPGVELVFCGYADRNFTLFEMAEWYAGIDVYVCASLSEGSNNSLLEAAATGCAIITTDNGTVPEYLHDGIEALIIPRERHAFVSSVERLRDDADLRKQLGDAAAGAVHPRWTWQVKAQEYRMFFRNAIHARADARRRMATTTPAGQRWMTGRIETVQRAMANGQHTVALAALDELLHADATNEGFRQVREQLLAMHAIVAQRAGASVLVGPA
jgi:glycosyltransferase involved in cell wall biosynthesis